MKADPYNFAPTFERIIAVMLITHPRFYTRVGHALEPDALGMEATKLALKAVKLIAKDTGAGPSDQAIVLQRLERLRHEGQITKEQILEVVDLLIDAPLVLPDEESIVAELVPVLQRRIQANAVRLGIDDYAKKGDMSAVVRMVQAANSLGRQDLSVGLRLGMGSFEELEQMRQIDRLPTGIMELDAVLEGGLARGCLGLYVSPPGGGKSMFLAHITATAMRLGLFVVVATLEINRALWSARVKANLTGRPINEITRGDPTVVRKMIDKMYPVLGTCFVESFPAGGTTALDVIDWTKRCADLEKYEPAVIVVDYFGKMKSHIKDDNLYLGQGTVYETMRVYGEENSKWTWTADQPKTRAAGERKRRIQGEDIGDSRKKFEIVDLFVSGNKHMEDDSDPQVEYHVGKNRYGQAEVSVGPLPTDWQCARMVPIVDEM